MKYKDPQKGNVLVRGKVKVQIDVLPADQADKNPVGKAREEPNHSPNLPQPEGRIKLSINPFEMFSQLIGPEIRRKIYCLICMAFCCTLFLAMIPSFIGSLIVKLILG